MRFLASLAALLTLSACLGPASVTRTYRSTSTFGALEQEITVTPSSQPEDKIFRLSSRLINRGSQPLTVRVVTCVLRPGKTLRTRGRLNQVAIPGCVRTPDVVTLAPGEASGSVGFVGQYSLPGWYTIRVRHALEPEFWGRIRIFVR